jgi:hypothetical protein
MTRGRRGSLILRRRALPSPPPCRFIPALSPDPGPRQQIHRHLRCRVRQRSHPHPAHTSAGTPGKRHRRTMDRHPPPRTAGPDAHPQPAPAWDRAGRVCGALQRPSSSPNTEPDSAAPTAPTPCAAFPASRPTSRSARWTDTRIFPGRMTWMTNSAPTGQASRGPDLGCARPGSCQADLSPSVPELLF